MAGRGAGWDTAVPNTPEGLGNPGTCTDTCCHHWSLSWHCHSSGSQQGDQMAKRAQKRLQMAKHRGSVHLSCSAQCQQQTSAGMLRNIWGRGDFPPCREPAPEPWAAPRLCGHQGQPLSATPQSQPAGHRTCWSLPCSLPAPLPCPSTRKGETAAPGRALAQGWALLPHFPASWGKN